MMDAPPQQRAPLLVLETPNGPVRLELRDPVSLQPAPRNVMGHSDQQMQRLVASIGAHGFLEIPVYNERTDHIVAGHARREGAIANHLPLIPVFVGNWSQEQEDALSIALQGKQYGDWNEEVLDQVLADLAGAHYDLDATGLEPWRWEGLVAGLQRTPVDLDTLAQQHGAYNERASWPIIRVQVTPEAKAIYDRLMALVPGMDEAARFERLMVAAEEQLFAVAEVGDA